MIVYDLSCCNNHRFEGWFASSTDYAEQQADGLLTCPECGTDDVSKAPMAPSVSAKGNTRPEERADAGKPDNGERQPVANAPMPPEVTKALEALAKAQAKALKSSDWVGDRFAEESRAMHYGEADERAIHGEASAEEAQSLIDEGIAVAPLPFPVSPPDKLN